MVQTNASSCFVYIFARLLSDLLLFIHSAASLFFFRLFPPIFFAVYPPRWHCWSLQISSGLSSSFCGCIQDHPGVGYLAQLFLIQRQQFHPKGYLDSSYIISIRLALKDKIRGVVLYGFLLQVRCRCIEQCKVIEPLSQQNDLSNLKISKYKKSQSFHVDPGSPK